MTRSLNPALPRSGRLLGVLLLGLPRSGRLFGVLLLGLLLAASPQEDKFAPISSALEKTAAKSYAFKVSGKYDRSGEFSPPGTLTSRIRQYRSARVKDRILVRGPEGLWKKPGESLGEKIENPDPDAADIVRTLAEAELPHRMVKYLIELSTGLRGPVDREVNGVRCRRYMLALDRKKVRKEMEPRIERAVRAGVLDRPDEIWWSSMRAKAWIYVDREGGRLVRVVDERSVKVAYKTEGRSRTRTYKTDMVVVFSDWGKAKTELPPGLKD